MQQADTAQHSTQNNGSETYKSELHTAATPIGYSTNYSLVVFSEVAFDSNQLNRQFVLFERTMRAVQPHLTANLVVASKQ